MEILSNAGAHAGELLQRRVLGKAGTLGWLSTRKLGAGEPRSLKRDLSPVSIAGSLTWALGFLGFMLDLYPGNAGKYMQRVGPGVTDVAWAAEPGCSHSHGSGRDVHSLSLIWVIISIKWSHVLQFFWMIILLNLQFRELRNTEKSQFVLFRLSPSLRSCLFPVDQKSSSVMSYLLVYFSASFTPVAETQCK